MLACLTVMAVPALTVSGVSGWVPEAIKQKHPTQNELRALLHPGC
jgi:hypothetical protein